MTTFEITNALHSLLLLAVAALFGGLIGFQREKAGKAAGLRTHMLVSVGTAFFVIACDQAGFSQEGMSRVVQGIITGIGFLGGGAILKGDSESEIRGLTTAASLWMATAIGAAAGFGLILVAFAGTLLAYIILSVLLSLERKIT
jgi:putative Mg2+ transporter-C (MgtC) family protein